MPNQSKRATEYIRTQCLLVIKIILYIDVPHQFHKKISCNFLHSNRSLATISKWQVLESRGTMTLKASQRAVTSMHSSMSDTTAFVLHLKDYCFI